MLIDDFVVFWAFRVLKLEHLNGFTDLFGSSQIFFRGSFFRLDFFEAKMVGGLVCGVLPWWGDKVLSFIADLNILLDCMGFNKVEYGLVGRFVLGFVFHSKLNLFGFDGSLKMLYVETGISFQRLDRLDSWEFLFDAFAKKRFLVFGRNGILRFGGGIF